MFKKITFSTLLLFAGFLSLFGQERAKELGNEMWSDDNSAFSNTEIPEKWADKSAVILAQFNRFEYRKPIIIRKLNANSYFHVRVMLNDKNAVNEYSELHFPANNGISDVYTGFKVIKPDGTEIIIDESAAVIMEQEVENNRRAYKKLAIPNLNVGDIIDYYICEEEGISLASNMHFFTPVLHHLPQEYPVVEQRIEFCAQRRCFISMRSLNGAPELQSYTDEENDEVTYFLVDKDRDGVKDLRWFYPYRELPSIKFRAAYASGKAIRNSSVFLDEPGVVKDSVSQKELALFLGFILNNLNMIGKDMHKYVKRNVDKKAGAFEKAKAGYFFRRNRELEWDQVTTIADKDTWSQGVAMQKDNMYQALDRFGFFLFRQDIPYDYVVAIPREISSLDDLLFENEISLLIRIKQGDEYMYISPVSNFGMPGEIDPSLMGTEAYLKLDDPGRNGPWFKKITLPSITKEDNYESSDIDVEIDEDMESVSMNIDTRLLGPIKKGHQYRLLDVYDYLDEESDNYDMKTEFEGTLWMKKKLLTLRESYLKEKDKYRNRNLMSMAENSFDFEIDTVSDFVLNQSGRFDNVPDMNYSFSIETTDLIKKVGPNYLLNVGKLIQRQVKIEKDELERKHNIYIDNPRSYVYTININIPEGYSVQGLENLKNNIENEQGGFVTSATIDGNKLIVRSKKYYNNMYAPSEEWPKMVEFLNAAYDFTEQKVLLKKM